MSDNAGIENDYFHVVYMRNIRRVYRVCYLRLGNREDAEDAPCGDAEWRCTGGSCGDCGVSGVAADAVSAVLGHASGGDGEYGSKVNREKVQSARNWEIAPFHQL